MKLWSLMSFWKYKIHFKTLTLAHQTLYLFYISDFWCMHGRWERYANWGAQSIPTYSLWLVFNCMLRLSIYYLLVVYLSDLACMCFTLSISRPCHDLIYSIGPYWSRVYYSRPNSSSCIILTHYCKVFRFVFVCMFLHAF